MSDNSLIVDFIEFYNWMSLVSLFVVFRYINFNGDNVIFFYKFVKGIL